MNFHKHPTMYVNHIDLQVTDLQQSIYFYEEVIGFAVKENLESQATLTANGYDILLTLIEGEEGAGRHIRTTGLYHFALLLPERKDLAHIAKYFVEKGVRFGSGDHSVSEALYLSDPDGNGIEIYADRDFSSWDWKNDEVSMVTKAVNFEALLSVGRDSIWDGLPNDTVLGHVHLQVSDLRANELFYVDGLGFEIVSRFGDSALFVADNHYHHHLAFNTWAGKHVRHRQSFEPGLISLTVVFPNKEIREAAINRLKKTNNDIFRKEGIIYAIDPSKVKVILSIVKD